MPYPVVRRPDYDFIGQSYADRYPNLHRYPAALTHLTHFQQAIQQIDDSTVRGFCLVPFAETLRLARNSPRIGCRASVVAKPTPVHLHNARRGVVGYNKRVDSMKRGIL